MNKNIKLTAVLMIGLFFFFSGCKPKSEIDNALKNKDIDTLIRHLKSHDVMARRDAANALGELGTDAMPAVPGLIKALGDPDTRVCVIASGVLVSIGSPAIPELISGLENKDVDIRSAVTIVLGRISLDDKAAIPGIVIALEDESLDVRQVAEMTVDVLVRLKSVPKEGDIPYLIEALKCKKGNRLRDYAIYSLIHLGKTAVPLLTVSLKNENGNIRKGAALILGKNGPGAYVAVPFLITALNDRDKGVREMAVHALGDIGPSAKRAVPALIPLLRDDGREIRGETALTLGKMGTAAKEAIPALFVTLKDNDWYVRGEAADALGNIGTETNTKIVAALKEAQKDKESYVRDMATGALKKLQKGNY